MDCFWKDDLPIHPVLNPHFCDGKLHGQILKTVLRQSQFCLFGGGVFSDKQRENEQERARVNRQSISDKQREKEHEQTGRIVLSSNGRKNKKKLK